MFNPLALVLYNARKRAIAARIRAGTTTVEQGRDELQAFAGGLIRRVREREKPTKTD